MDFIELKGILEQEHKEYKSMPFWSWNNELDEENLVAQIEDMHEAGIGGFIMHARTGLKTEYLGEKWFSCIEACLKKAKELGMEAWAYDENGWPSGFVGGKLLEKEEFLAQFLTYEVKDCFDAAAFAVYQKTEEGYALIDGEKGGVKEYHSVYLHTSPANTDILNPDVVDAFIKETHEKYYERFKDSFGKELVGFFTDEPQYYRWNTPYSKCVAEEFIKEGLNVKDGLIYLFIQDKAGYEFRTKYYSTLNKLYVQNFYKKLYDWCDSHNCKLTGHSIEESVLAFQMMSCAGVTPTYEFEHMPAVDWLGKVIPHELMMKQVGSVASQLGKKHILTETFACSGYETTPRELKSIAEFQYFGGVNRTCQHLYPYSMSAQGKFDHPPFFAKHSNWFNEFKTFNTYFDRLGFIIGETKELYDVGIIHPMRSIYLDYLRSDYIYSVKDFDDIFVGLLETLAANGITYHLIDESILERHGKNVGNTLQVGNCQYNTVIIPDMPTIASTTLALLKAFKGKLLSLGGLEYVDGIPQTVSLQSNITFEDIVANTAVKVKNKGGRYALNARKGEIGEFIFIKNHSNEESCSLDVENFAEYKALDLTTLTLSAIEKHNEIAGGGGLILLKDNTPCEQTKVVSTVDITDNFAVKGITENYLVIDQVSYSFDGIDYTEKMPVQQAFERLLRMDYKGKLFVKYDFEVKDLVSAKLLLEKAKYESFTVNGREVEFVQSDFDFLFQEGDISKYLRLGKNEIVYSMEYYEHDGVHFALFDPMATESVKNCLYYDTSIENIYLYGEFSLDEGYALCEKKLPTAMNGIEKQGYPFFKGKVVYVGKYTYSGEGRTLLTLNGDYLVAHIAANGKSVEVVMDTTVDVTDLLKKGENHLEITIHTSLRNLLGPHHTEWSFSITPASFTLRGEWEDGKPQRYVDDYLLVNIGIQKIEIKETK